MIHDKKGRPAQSPEQKATIHLEHFADIEAAHVISEQSMHAKYNDYASRPKPPVMLQLANVNTLSQVHRTAMHVKVGKAGNGDGIGNHLIRAGGHSIARHIHALTTKTQLLRAEAFEDKGGTAHPPPAARDSPPLPLLPLAAAWEHPWAAHCGVKVLLKKALAPTRSCLSQTLASGGKAFCSYDFLQSAQACTHSQIQHDVTIYVMIGAKPENNICVTCRFCVG